MKSLGTCIMLWGKLKPIVEGVRKEFNQLEFSDNAEYFFNEMKKKEQQATNAQWRVPLPPFFRSTETKHAIDSQSSWLMVVGAESNLSHLNCPLFRAKVI